MHGNVLTFKCKSVKLSNSVAGCPCFALCRFGVRRSCEELSVMLHTAALFPGKNLSFVIFHCHAPHLFV